MTIKETIPSMLVYENKENQRKELLRKYNCLIMLSLNFVLNKQKIASKMVAKQTQLFPTLESFSCQLAPNITWEISFCRNKLPLF